MSALLAAEAVSCTRGTRTLFRALSFELAPGQVLRIEGANGTGKTSLLRLLAGLALPSDGQVRWDGTPIAAQRERYAGELFYLGHAPALKDDLTPLENLRAAAALHGEDADDRRLDAALVAWGLAAARRLRARVLSAGQRRRVALARLSLTRARLWILDEPFNALDGHACALLAQHLVRHAERGGLAVVTSHQDLPDLGAVRPRSLALDA